MFSKKEIKLQVICNSMLKNLLKLNNFKADLTILIAVVGLLSAYEVRSLIPVLVKSDAVWPTTCHCSNVLGAVLPTAQVLSYGDGLRHSLNSKG